MKKRVVEWLYTTLPRSWYLRLKSTWRFLRYSQHRTLLRMQKEYTSQHGLTIQGGPFAGMQYIEEAVGSILLPKLIGSYEEVLHPIIKDVLEKHQPTTIIDIGVAEGYYLVGLGKHLPTSKLIGYDIDLRALDLTRTLYKANGLVNPLELFSEVSYKKLSKDTDNNTLLICDIEGHEDSLLDPALCPALLSIPYMLIETHDCKVPHVSKKIQERFTKTHDISIIAFQKPNKEKYHFLKNKSEREILAVAEERGDLNQEWLWLTLKK